MHISLTNNEEPAKIIVRIISFVASVIFLSLVAAFREQVTKRYGDLYWIAVLMVSLILLGVALLWLLWPSSLNRVARVFSYPLRVLVSAMRLPGIGANLEIIQSRVVRLEEGVKKESDELAVLKDVIQAHLPMTSRIGIGLQSTNSTAQLQVLKQLRAMLWQYCDDDLSGVEWYDHDLACLLERTGDVCDTCLSDHPELLRQCFAVRSLAYNLDPVMFPLCQRVLRITALQRLPMQIRALSPQIINLYVEVVSKADRIPPNMLLSSFLKKLRAVRASDGFWELLRSSATPEHIPFMSQREDCDRVFKRVGGGTRAIVCVHGDQDCEQGENCSCRLRDISLTGTFTEYCQREAGVDPFPVRIVDCGAGETKSDDPKNRIYLRARFCQGGGSSGMGFEFLGEHPNHPGGWQALCTICGKNGNEA